MSFFFFLIMHVLFWEERLLGGLKWVKKNNKTELFIHRDGQKKSSSSGFSGVITSKQKLMYRHVDV